MSKLKPPKKDTYRSSMQPPPPAPVDVEQKYKQSKLQLEKCFAEFHRLLQDKTLDENKSTASKSNEQFVVNELVKASVALDTLNVGEGVLAMAVIAIREHLKLRDRVNELEYEIEKLRKDIKNSSGSK